MNPRSRPGPLLHAVGVTVVGFLPLGLLAAMSIQLQRELSFGPTRLGLAASIFFVASSVGSLPFGRLVDRIGPSLGLRLASVAAMLVLTGIGAAVGTWEQLAIGMFGAGLTNSFAQVSANAAVAGGIRQGRQGIAFGSKQAAVPIAALAAGATVPLAIAWLGWRPIYLAAAVIAAGFAATVPHVAGHTRPGDGEARKQRPKLAPLTGLAIAGACAGAAGNSAVSFLVDSGVAMGIREGSAGALLAFASALAVVARVGMGWFVDRRASDGLRELVILMLIGVVGFVGLGLGEISPVLFVAGAVLAFAGGWGWPALIYYATVRRSPDAPAVTTGYVLSGVYIGTIAGPAVFGLIAERGHYSLAWSLGAGLLLVAATVAKASATAFRRGTPLEIGKSHHRHPEE